MEVEVERRVLSLIDSMSLCVFVVVGVRRSKRNA